MGEEGEAEAIMLGVGLVIGSAADADFVEDWQTV